MLLNQSSCKQTEPAYKGAAVKKIVVGIIAFLLAGLYSPATALAVGTSDLNTIANATDEATRHETLNTYGTENGAITSENEQNALDVFTFCGKSAEALGIDLASAVPQVNCKRATIFDDNGTYVFGKNAGEQVKIASVTKTMTALVASEFPMETPIVVTPFAAGIPGSFAGIVEGDQTTLYEMLKGLMLPSGNDAAYAIAGTCGKIMLDRENSPDAQDEMKCIERFVNEMNTKASDLGMNDTLFCNPCGLDDEGFEGDHHSTAYDVTLMSHAAYDVPAIREMVSRQADVLHCERAGQHYELPLSNSNRLLAGNADARGMKTGFTDMAGSCVAGVFEDGRGKTYYVTVLGSDTYDACFQDSITLYDWIRAQEAEVGYLDSIPVQFTDGEAFIGQVGHRDWIDKRFNVKITGYNGESYAKYVWENDMSTNISLDENALRGNISDGDAVGAVAVCDNAGNTVATYDVIAAEEMKAPSWYEALRIALIRIFSPVFGGQITHASDELIT